MRPSSTIILRAVLSLSMLGAPGMASAQRTVSDHWPSTRRLPATPMPRTLGGAGLDLLAGSEVMVDVTPLLDPAYQDMPEPPLPPRRPMFSRGWSRDGFGGQQGGWR
jgi:hypothetical protein